MKLAIISGNPKNEGLCSKMTEEIIRGAKSGNAEVVEITMQGISGCRSCNGGQGSCLSEYHCIFGKDGFDDAQNKIQNAEAIAIVTPVYWAEINDGLKMFLDRLRRCESSTPFNPRKAALTGKPVLLMTSAGGSGRGYLTALEELERFCQHTGAVIYDSFGVNRWNHDYKGLALYSAAKTMVEGRKPGESI